MRNQFLHGLIVLSVVVTFPDEARAHAGTSDEALRILRDCHRADRYFILFRVELFSLVLGKIPDANPTRLVAEVDLALVRVQDCRINHYALVVKIAHEASSFKVKYLECAILAGREEPLVVTLEFKRCDVTSVPLEQTFLVDGLPSA